MAPVSRQHKEQLDRIVEAIIFLNTESRRLARESCARFGITATQLSVIKMLDEIGDLSLSRLSAVIGANNSTVTGIVDRMERDGLVRREHSDDDRRVWMIRLTERGRRLAREIDIAPWDALREAIMRLGEKDRAKLLAILSRVAAEVATIYGANRQ
jgi:MarR family transcriptional regulator, organic hydroperoxide resistance regulator